MAISQLTTMKHMLGKTASTLGKVAVAEQYKGVDWVMEAVQYCYDPFMQYYIKKLPPVNPDQEGEAVLNEAEWEYYVKPVLTKLHNRGFVSNQERDEAIAGLLMRYSPEDRDTVQKILLKDLRVGFGAKGFNTAVGWDLIPVPDTQLCKTYDPVKPANKVEFWWATPKFNGLRGRYIQRQAGMIKEETFRLLTREDNILWGFSELQAELLELAEAGRYRMVDGEIFSFEIPFQTIMSIAREEKNFDPATKAKLKMYIFNVQMRDRAWDSTEEMVQDMNRVFAEAQAARGRPFQYIEIVEYQQIPNDPVAIRKACIRYMLSGYEGIVLRDPVVSWEASARNNHLLKYKLFNEADLKVIRPEYGVKGKKWQDKVAALVCEGTIPAIKRQMGENTFVYIPVSGSNTDYLDSLGTGTEIFDVPVRVEASLSSLKDPERDAMTVEAMEGKLKGRMAEVKFQAITDTPNALGMYSLQFPVFVKFKD